MTTTISAGSGYSAPTGRNSSDLFKQMILHGAAAITAQKQAINDLNVFPVPDGDTGTNMSMTIATAA